MSIARNVSLSEDVLRLEGKVTDKQAARKLERAEVEKAKGSVIAFEEQIGDLVDYKRLLETSQVEGVHKGGDVLCRPRNEGI